MRGYTEGAACVAALVAAVGSVTPAEARTSPRRNYSIRSQDLEQALREFGMVSGEQIIFTPSSVRGFRNAPVQGSYDTRGALDRLLSGSPLRARRAGSGIFILERLEAWPFQVTRQTTPSARVVAAPPPNAAPPAPSDTDIIVTATRRNAALSNVPIAVTALSGQQVAQAHIENFRDLPAAVPGAVFLSPKGQSTANIAIRGQSAINDAPGLELPVAIFQDDIYYGTMASFDADFYDIGQIAILRGPQGTTFGRNVVGGALQITSNKPQIGVNDGAINLSLESYASSRSPDEPGFAAQGFFNGTLSQNAAVRLAYSARDVGGYMHNYTTGHDLSDQKSFSVRPSLLWTPHADLKITGFFSWTHQDEAASGYHAYGQGSVIAANEAISDSPWGSFQDVDGTNKRDIIAAQIRLDWTRSIGTISSISSYRSLHANYVDDGDSSPRPGDIPSINFSKEYQLSEELRLTSPSDRRFEYVAGLYYSFEDLRKAITIGVNGTDPVYLLSAFTGGLYDLQTADGDIHVTSLAPYAEGKLHVTDQLALTVGGRYSIEHKTGSTIHVGGSPFWGFTPYNVTFEHTWRAFTPRAILELKPREGVLLYGSISTGFKGGGWNLTNATAATAITPLKPERSTSYELGAKLRLFNGRLIANIALFQADTKNLQVRSFVNGVQSDSNAGLERARGFEAETTAIPIENLRLGVNYAYTEAVYRSFPGCAGGGVDCTGNTVPFVPRHDVRLSAEYRWILAGGGTLTAHVDDQWSSRTQVSPVNNSQPLAVPYTAKRGILNAWLVYAPDNANWSIQLWGKNLANKWFISQPSNYYFYFLTKAEFAAKLGEVERGVVNPPRQLGATFSYKF